MNQPPTSHNLPEYSISEIAGAIKQQIEDRFGYVRVRGELSGFKVASSGHAYFKLKDDKALLDAVCWRGNLAKMSFKPEDGLEVSAYGRVTTYPGRSTYQIIVDKMEPAGAGALMALLEERKKLLAKEGLFDEARKKPLPFLPQTIGVVTSPTGAVIQDILHRIAERFPCRVIVWPVAVQGQDAAAQIAAAIDGFNRFTPSTGDQCGANPVDLIIVARGGGSVEDLWAFNEEVVVRAAANSTIPLISAVGHETDTTLIDYASDKRAPTPTAAAEMAVPVKAELSLLVGERELRLKQCMQRLCQTKQLMLHAQINKLPRPKHLMELAEQRLDGITERLEQALPKWFERKKEQLMSLAARLTPNIFKKDITLGSERLHQLDARMTRVVQQLLKRRADQLEHASRMLASVSHESVLGRGFALVKTEDGRLVSSAKQAASLTHMQLQFADGETKVKQEK